MGESIVTDSVTISELADLDQLVEDLQEGTVLSIRIEEVMTLAEKEGE